MIPYLEEFSARTRWALNFNRMVDIYGSVPTLLDNYQAFGNHAAICAAERTGIPIKIIPEYQIRDRFMNAVLNMGVTRFIEYRFIETVPGAVWEVRPCSLLSDESVMPDERLVHAPI